MALRPRRVEPDLSPGEYADLDDHEVWEAWNLEHAEGQMAGPYAREWNRRIIARVRAQRERLLDS